MTLFYQPTQKMLITLEQKLDSDILLKKQRLALKLVTKTARFYRKIILSESREHLPQRKIN